MSKGQGITFKNVWLISVILYIDRNLSVFYLQACSYINYHHNV